MGLWFSPLVNPIKSGHFFGFTFWGFPGFELAY